MKKFFWVNFWGTAIGGALFIWFSPNVIQWYYTPPADQAFSCGPAVTWALETYRKVILGGMIFGLFMSSLLFFAIKSKMANKTANQKDAAGSLPQQ